MSFTNNASNLTGKSTTNAFNVIAESLTVNKNTLCKGDLTVLGTTNIGNVSLENGYVNNLTVNNFTATNPVPITSGGTGLATIGAPNQVLTVNPAGTGLLYAAPGLINPATIIGTAFTGNPTLTLGLEADTGSLGRGFIRTGIAAVSGLCLGTSTATVLRLWSNFATDSNAEIINTNANFTYNSTGSSGVFQVLNGGGGISFTNSGIGTISMATAAGNLSMAAGAGTLSLTTGVGATSITTGAGTISLTTGAGNISLTTAAAGIISLAVATAGAINIGTALGAVNIYGSLLTLAAPAIYIGTALIPSVLVFACGDVTGVTGFWNITTLAFQLNAASISLNSTLTIALNNNTTVAGSSSIYTSGVLNVTNSSTSQATIGSFMTPNLPSGSQSVLTFGKNPSAYQSTEFNYIYNTTNSLISTSWGFYGGLGSRITLRPNDITLTSTTTNINGILNVINGNIFTNQNIIGGIEIINSGNLALSATSPGLILIRGGSGSIITVPDATTLIVGYTYTINNNSNHTATVNYHNSGTIGTVPSLNAATVTCINTNSVNGQWDIHITGPTTGTDWATPGQIGSAVPNTGAFTTLSATADSSVYTSGVLNITNTTTSSATVARFITPNLPSGSQTVFNFGKDSSLNQSAEFTYSPNSTTSLISTSWGFYGGAGANIKLQPAQINLIGDTFAQSSFQSTTRTGFNITNNNTNPGIASIVEAPLLSTNNTVYFGVGKAIAAFDMALVGFLSNGTSSKAIFTIVGSSTTIDQAYNGNIFLTAPTTVVSNALTAGNTTLTGTTNLIGTLSCTSTIAAGGTIRSNSNNLSNSSSLNPGLFVYSDISNSYGMDFGYNTTTSRYRTRIFCASVGGNLDIALSGRSPNAVFQSDFTDHLIVNGTTGATRINGTLTCSSTITATGTIAASNLKSSNTVYYSSAETEVSNNTWTNVNYITTFRQKGTNTLTWVNQTLGFQNQTGVAVLVNVSWACQRVSNGFGVTALRISRGAVDTLGTQDVSALDAVSISANTYLDPNETVQCSIYQNSGAICNYQNVVVTINTSPLFL